MLHLHFDVATTKTHDLSKCVVERSFIRIQSHIDKINQTLLPALRCYATRIAFLHFLVTQCRAMFSCCVVNYGSSCWWWRNCCWSLHHNGITCLILFCRSGIKTKLIKKLPPSWQKNVVTTKSHFSTLVEVTLIKAWLLSALRIGCAIL